MQLLSCPAWHFYPLQPAHPHTVSPRQGLWNTLLSYFKESGCLVEGPLTNLKASMVQLHKPKRVRPGWGGAPEGLHATGGANGCTAA